MGWVKTDILCVYIYVYIERNDHHVCVFIGEQNSVARPNGDSVETEIHLAANF